MRGGWVGRFTSSTPQPPPQPEPESEPAEEDKPSGAQPFGQPEAEQPEPVNDGLTEENWGSQGNNNNEAPAGGSNDQPEPSNLSAGGESGETDSWGEADSSSSSEGEAAASGNPDQGFE